MQKMNTETESGQNMGEKVTVFMMRIKARCQREVIAFPVADVSSVLCSEDFEDEVVELLREYIEKHRKDGVLEQALEAPRKHLTDDAAACAVIGDNNRGPVIGQEEAPEVYTGPRPLVV
ncbi:hypothetical protein A2456_01205 [Candidatus Nomurabacteria bacterium RIFOXYC2_FULL_36_19]|uniref:Uncharacterized protein n=1 Tax=Candidatus Nomurabacteria bacterium RIFOXYC2_FULL_36_19 TaxID=1801806 RepID=A0A1F6YS73_9BACT|nr:MAG: hypothetical protein A2238_02845 [Candidatus Nomurabacteria bacterium RIFOXYA2_FULL_35_9]OGJ09215.1 MAG: hypothetical protein A2456_01205 [Candidatus Nomurabacteria bacterium RIFOXYC2_FULL_36_19]OGJ14501.1 MAG: hypothetical protein A2554_01540 [Candidatus Nomurabacteria bacterium RIFOXYD2_FULL_35_12]